jgi:hypothetical protein
MSFRVEFEFPFPLDYEFNVALGHFTFLCQSMRKHRRYATVKKIKNAIIHCAEFNP